MIKGSLKNMFIGKAYISNTQLHSVIDQGELIDGISLFDLETNDYF